MERYITAGDYLAQAKTDIDSVFGEGYAFRNPSLVAAHMQTTAILVQGYVLTNQVREGVDKIANAMRNSRGIP